MKALLTYPALVLAGSMSMNQLAAQNESTSPHATFISRDCLWYADHSIVELLKLTPEQTTALNDIRRRHPRRSGLAANVRTDSAANETARPAGADPRFQPQYDAQGRQLPTATAPDKTVQQEEFDQMDNTQDPPLGASDGKPNDPASDLPADGSDVALQMELKKAFTLDQIQQWQKLCEGQYEKDKKGKRHSSIR